MTITVKITFLVGSNVRKSTLPSLPPCYLCGETAGDQHRNDDAENIEFMIRLARTEEGCSTHTTRSGFKLENPQLPRIGEPDLARIEAGGYPMGSTHPCHKD